MKTLLLLAGAALIGATNPGRIPEIHIPRGHHGPAVVVLNEPCGTPMLEMDSGRILVLDADGLTISQERVDPHRQRWDFVVVGDGGQVIKRIPQVIKPVSDFIVVDGSDPLPEETYAFVSHWTEGAGADRCRYMVIEIAKPGEIQYDKPRQLLEQMTREVKACRLRSDN